MEKFENLNELIVALLLWITTHTEYKDPKKFPQIKFIEQKELSEMACGRECEILALTPEVPKYTIFLSKSLSPMDDVCDRGILLHELIHILQEDQNVPYPVHFYHLYYLHPYYNLFLGLFVLFHCFF